VRDWTFLSAADLPVYLLALARVSGVLALAPVFGSPLAPRPVKAFLALVLAALFLPLVRGAGVPADAGIGVLALAAAGELAFGLVIGFAAALLFAAVQLAGQILDQELGVQQAALLDPFSDAPVAVVGQFKVFLATVVYLLVDGHHYLLASVAESFQAVPLLAASLGADAALHLSSSLPRDLFRMAAQIAAPALVTVFLVTLALAFMARGVPELNAFGTAFPVRFAAGLLVLALGVGLFVAAFKTQTLRHADSVGRLVGLLGG
jgi:flagellar biosynthetic protein FliR